MDKHQRRHIAKWEAKKAKDQRKFEEYMKRHAHEQALERIARAVAEWEPSPNDVFRKARELLSSWPRLRLINDERYEFMWTWRLLISKRCRVFLTEIEIEAEIAEERSWKEEDIVYRLAASISRHQSRVNTIREELLQKTDRLRAVQTCWLIKEELMMKVWHPRRVEHILETYGWEAYEKLLGVE